MPGYRVDVRVPKDSDTGRRVEGRFVVNLLTLVVGMGTPILALYWLLGLAPHIGTHTGGNIGILIGMVGGLIAWNWFIPRMLVSNSEWTGYVTLNPFASNRDKDGKRAGLVPYGPGLHLSYWFEERNEEGTISLETKTETFTLTTPTATSKVTLTVEYTYGIALSGLLRATGRSSSTVKQGITGFIEALITDYAATLPYDKVNVGDLNKKIDEWCRNAGRDDLQKISAGFGLQIVNLQVTKRELPGPVQDSLDSIAEIEAMSAAIAAWLGIDKKELAARIQDGRLTLDQYKELANRAMATSGNAKMQINVVELNAKPEVMVALERMFGGGEAGGTAKGGKS